MECTLISPDPSQQPLEEMIHVPKKWNFAEWHKCQITAF